MVKHPRHPKQEVELALQFAEANGFEVIKREGKGHAWGVARCNVSCTIWI